MGALATKITQFNLEADVDRRRRARAYYTSPEGQRALLTSRMQRWLSAQAKERASDAAARAAQEAAPRDAVRGERVFVARCIADGTLHFWAVLAGGERLEIARAGEAQNASDGEGVFKASMGAGDVTAERARLKASPVGNGDLDGYHVALVGWAAPGVDCGAQLAQLAGWAAETMSRGEAQALLGHAVGGLVLRRRQRALDWGWAAADAEPRRVRDRWLAAPPVAMLQYLLDCVFDGGDRARMKCGALTQAEDSLQTQVQMQVESRMHEHVQDQVQMQVQSQIQSQIESSVHTAALFSSDTSSSSSGGGSSGGGGGGGGSSD